MYVFLMSIGYSKKQMLEFVTWKHSNILSWVTNTTNKITYKITTTNNKNANELCEDHKHLWKFFSCIKNSVRSIFMICFFFYLFVPPSLLFLYSFTYVNYNINVHCMHGKSKEVILKYIFIFSSFLLCLFLLLIHPFHSPYLHVYIA